MNRPHFYGFFQDRGEALRSIASNLGLASDSIVEAASAFVLRDEIRRKQLFAIVATATNRASSHD
jgi:hypothetical protein